MKGLAKNKDEIGGSGTPFGTSRKQNYPKNNQQVEKTDSNSNSIESHFTVCNQGYCIYIKTILIRKTVLNNKKQILWETIFDDGSKFEVKVCSQSWKVKMTPERILPILETAEFQLPDLQIEHAFCTRLHLPSNVFSQRRSHFLSNPKKYLEKYTQLIILLI